MSHSIAMPGAWNRRNEKSQSRERTIQLRGWSAHRDAILIGSSNEVQNGSFGFVPIRLANCNARCKSRNSLVNEGPSSPLSYFAQRAYALCTLFKRKNCHRFFLNRSILLARVYRLPFTYSVNIYASANSSCYILYYLLEGIFYIEESDSTGIRS